MNKIAVQGFKASSNMLANGIMGFHMTGRNGDVRLYYRDRFQGKDTTKWIGLNSDEAPAFIDMFAAVEKNRQNQAAQNKLRGAAVTFIKYVRTFQKRRINTELE